MAILAVIAARGGSMGVPGKNVRPLLGVPLIVRAVTTLLSADVAKRVVVSTDDTQIANAARAAGAEVPFMRPVELARSNTGKFQVWQHALEACEAHYGERYDSYLDLDCTNPLIEPTDILAAYSAFKLGRPRGVDAIFTVARARRNPYFNLVEPDPDGALRMSKSLGAMVLSRQAAPLVFEHVAGVYVLDAEYLRRASHLLEGRSEGYEVPEEKAFDVDSELDFILIEHLLKIRIAGEERGI